MDELTIKELIKYLKKHIEKNGVKTLTNEELLKILEDVIKPDDLFGIM